MTRVARLLHLDDGEFPELRAAIEAKPLPARPVPKPAGWGRDMIAFLRSQDAPAAPRPPQRFTPDLLARLAFVSTAMHADYERHLDTMRVLDVISAVWAAATDTHALRMALAPVEAMLNAQVAK